MSKAIRQKAILELLKHGPVASQESMQRELGKQGFRVGQATLSRDIRELGLSKTPGGYMLTQLEAAGELALPSISRLAREFVLQVRAAQNLLLIKTSVGSAQPVAAALDEKDWPESIGTIAGDDTILMVCRDKKAAHKLAQRFEGMIA
jgi:transcriptional regulator of arginine metabolism